MISPPTGKLWQSFVLACRKLSCIPASTRPRWRMMLPSSFWTAPSTASHPSSWPPRERWVGRGWDRPNMPHCSICWQWEEACGTIGLHWFPFLAGAHAWAAADGDGVWRDARQGGVRQPVVSSADLNHLLGQEAGMRLVDCQSNSTPV